MAINSGGDSMKCPVCGEPRRAEELIPGSALHPVIQETLRERNAGWSTDDVACISCLANTCDPSTATDPADQPTRPPVHEAILERRTFGERVSDTVAAFVGSWTFLNIQLLFLIVWIAFNTVALIHFHFDPYPFIFLNLVLSWVGALEAPIILMSQNRQDKKDRFRDENEYQTNLAAEQEIRQLHAKLDRLIEKHLAELTRDFERHTQLLDRLVGQQPPDQGSPD